MLIPVLDALDISLISYLLIEKYCANALSCSLVAALSWARMGFPIVNLY